MIKIVTFYAILIYQSMILCGRIGLFEALGIHTDIIYSFIICSHDFIHILIISVGGEAEGRLPPRHGLCAGV